MVGEGGRRLEVNRHSFKLQMPWKQACRVTGAFIVAFLVSAFYRSRNSGTEASARDAIALSLQMRRRGSFREAYLSFRNRPRLSWFRKKAKSERADKGRSSRCIWIQVAYARGFPATGFDIAVCAMSTPAKKGGILATISSSFSHFGSAAYSKVNR